MRNLLFVVFNLALALVESSAQTVYSQAIDYYETSVMKGKTITMTLTDFKAAFNLTLLNYERFGLCKFTTDFSGITAYSEQNFNRNMSFSDFVGVGNDLYVISSDFSVLKYRVDPDVTKLLFMKSYQINRTNPNDTTPRSKPKGFFSRAVNNLNTLFVIDSEEAYYLDTDTGESKVFKEYKAIGEENFNDFDIMSFGNAEKDYLFIAAGKLGVLIYEIQANSLVYMRTLKETDFQDSTNLLVTDLIVEGEFLYALNFENGLHRFIITPDLKITKSKFYLYFLSGIKVSMLKSVFLITKKSSDISWTTDEIFWNESTQTSVVNRKFTTSEQVNHLLVGPTASFIIGKSQHFQFLTGISDEIVKEKTKIVTQFIRNDIQEISLLSYYNDNNEYLVAVTSNSVFLYRLNFPNPKLECTTNSSTTSRKYLMMISFLTRDCKNKTYLNNDSSYTNMCNNSMPVQLEVYDTPSEVEDNSVKVGLGVGLTFGLIFLIIFIIIMVWLYKRHQNKFKRFEDDSNKIGRGAVYQGGIPNNE